MIRKLNLKLSCFYLCFMDETTELRIRVYGCYNFDLPQDGTVFDSPDASNFCPEQSEKNIEALRGFVSPFLLNVGFLMQSKLNLTPNYTCQTLASSRDSFTKSVKWRSGQHVYDASLTVMINSSMQQQQQQHTQRATPQAA